MQKVSMAKFAKMYAFAKPKMFPMFFEKKFFSSHILRFHVVTNQCTHHS